ncbi:DNA-binding response regulator [Xaviernesmea oryzae]|uniref:DNA-binding response regulator n=1 Tax=Xaviernesmea oryzae TaxID=464029 RepID=A0A1Q9ASJ0_9HYPH|nr:response regulator transcription factor [Xaviernesmea oryzae]OLP58384.1 DNA-binding response regulator [Xaviernesmea oryzae]
MRHALCREDPDPVAVRATIIIADDHPLFRGAMAQALAAENGPVIIEAQDFASLRHAVAETPEADLLLLDLTMPGVSGFSGLMSLRVEHPALPVMVVSAHDDPATIQRALDLGACGFLSKSAGLDEIRAAIGTVLDGGIFMPPGFIPGAGVDPENQTLLQRLQSLTPQQARVLSMLAEGLLNKQIAYELGVSEATIKAHVSAILLKLHVDSRTQAVIHYGRILEREPERKV